MERRRLSTDHNPRVTVITPTYNRSEVLHYAVQSVLRQTFTDFEYWVVGDGCTDDSEAVVKAFNDPRVHWHNLPDNTGHQSAPINAAMARARGEFIAYLGHDDLWLPHHLQTLTARAEETGANMVHTGVIVIGAPGTTTRQILLGIRPAQQITRLLSVPPLALMHTRTLAQKVGEWPDFRSMQMSPDVEYFARLSEAGGKAVRAHTISALKFPAGWRRNIYAERTAEEQERYSRRMIEEPDFLTRELLDVVYALLTEDTTPPSRATTTDVAHHPPGWVIEERRRFRGLEARPIQGDTWAMRFRRFRRELRRRARRMRDAALGRA